MPNPHSDKEHALLRGLHRWDQAWSDRDYRKLQKVLHEEVVMHADGTLFEYDVRGAEAIVDIHRRYFYKFEYQHYVISTAANPETNAAFGFWQDEGIHKHEEPQVPSSGPPPKAGIPPTVVAPAKQEEQTSTQQGAQAGSPATIAGMWKLVFDDDCDKVKDIYFLRQLNPEEARHRLRDPSMLGSQGGAPVSRYPSPPHATDTASSSHLDVARRLAEGFSKIWQTGDTSGAKDILLDDGGEFRSLDLMHGGETIGQGAFCNMVKKVFEHWHVQKSQLDVGVSADGKTAMVHWCSEGKVPENDASFSMYGINLLVIDLEKGKIKESAGFRQMSPVEKEKMMRPDAFLHSGVPRP